MFVHAKDGNVAVKNDDDAKSGLRFDREGSILGKEVSLKAQWEVKLPVDVN